MNRPRPKRATVTVTEAAELLGVGRTTLYALARTGWLDEARTIPVLRFRSRLVVPRPALDKALGR